MDLLRLCTTNLVDRDVCKVALQGGPYSFTDDDVHLKLWFPILTGMQSVMFDRRLEVRTQYVRTTTAATVFLSIVRRMQREHTTHSLTFFLSSVVARARRLLLDIFKTYGGLISPSLWGLIFSGVVLPIFQHVRRGENVLTKEVRGSRI